MFRTFSTVVISAALVLIAASSASASQYKVIYTFQSTSGAYDLQTQMIADAAGNLYGVSQFGGANGLGAVFELSPNSKGIWTENILHSFSGGDGDEPLAALIMDKNGNLYGTTLAGGASSCESPDNICGTVYQLSPNGDGTWTETVLVDFIGDNGLSPDGSLVFDGAGNLYGTTTLGGANGWGTVFELSPNGDGTWTENVLHSFGLDANGSEPDSNLLLDTQGNLWGTTAVGGILQDCPRSDGCGTIFEMTPQLGGGWLEKVVLTFNGKNGIGPMGLTFDPSGNVFGYTTNGGVGTCSEYRGNGCGEIFELVASTGYTPRMIVQFANEPVAVPVGIVFDFLGNLYGTSLGGGHPTCGSPQLFCGTIFKGTPNLSSGYTFNVLYDFPGQTSNGFKPGAPLTIDSAGNIYGSTAFGGNPNCGINGGCGVVFQITP
ncbi:MAG: choice-of-anchor tandem repeat GloVer-containing protein [Candidatus Sulfotelmatobacter sp.]